MEKWSPLLKELGDKLIKPWKSPTFICYFFIILFSAVYTISIDFKSTTIATFAFALIGTSLYEIFVVHNKSGLGEVQREGLQREFNSVFVLLAFAGIMSAQLGLTGSSGTGSTCFASGSLILAFLLWWLANAGNAALVNEDASVILGGDADRELLGNDSHGFKV